LWTVIHAEKEFGGRQKGLNVQRVVSSFVLSRAKRSGGTRFILVQIMLFGLMAVAGIERNC